MVSRAALTGTDVGDDSAATENATTRQSSKAGIAPYLVVVASSRHVFGEIQVSQWRLEATTTYLKTGSSGRDRLQ